MNYEHETKIEMHFNYNGDYYCLYGLYSAEGFVCFFGVIGGILKGKW